MKAIVARFAALTRALLINLRIFDPDFTLSLSNIALMVIIYKLATAGELDWGVITAFFLTLMNHNARKVFASKRAATQDKKSNDIATLQAALDKTQQDVKSLIQINSLRK